MKTPRFMLIALVVCAQYTIAQTATLKVWPKAVPGAIHASGYDEEKQFDEAGKLRGYSKVSTPDLTIFLAPKNKANRTSVVICPGGGYSHLAIEKEGYKVARWLNSLGISAFVLKYRMPSDLTMNNKSVGPLQDAQEAIRIVRRNATQWNLDPEMVGIMGFSAGGHLAATLSTHFDEKVYDSEGGISARPDFSVLIYPVISMKDGVTHQGSKRHLLGEDPDEQVVLNFSNEAQVRENTPPTFLVHATDDQAVPDENSIAYYKALKKRGIPAKLVLYPDGGHGFGLGTTGDHTQWPQACKEWLIENGLIPDEEVLLFSYFKGNGEDGLHWAYSPDGYSWQALGNNRSFLQPQVGKDRLMRDPCVIRGGDGRFHMVWTVSWTDKGIGYATSEDLVNWSEQRFLPVMAYEPTTRNTWAPEVTYDPDSNIYMIYWASTIPGSFPETKSEKESGYNHRMYYTTTKDFKDFSKTKLLYEPGFNVIDSSIKKDGDRYVMFLKDETREPPQKNIKIAFADALTGPYSKAGPPITGNYWAEGPTATKINGRWTVYFDKYIDHEYGAVQSTNLKDWEDISDKIYFPEGTRHGSVLKVPYSLVAKLKAVFNEVE